MNTMTSERKAKPAKHSGSKRPVMGSDEARELGCTCRAREIWPTDISPPEVKLGKWCPVHGRDPDYERDKVIDDRLTGGV